MLEETSDSFGNPHIDNADIDSNESLDSSDATKKARKFNRDGDQLPEKMKEFIDGVQAHRKRREILSDIYKKENGVYKYNERTKYVKEANLAVEKKTASQRATGVLRPIAEKQGGGEDALNPILQNGQARVSIQDGTEYIFLKEYEVAWAFTTTHVPFIPT